MSTHAETFVTPEEYLAAERASEERSEYFDGEVLPMPGARRKHNLIVTNLVTSLAAQAADRPAEVYTSTMRVKVTTTGAYVYPDVVVTAERAKLEDEHNDTVVNPAVIIEVLSPSTEAHDRVRKWSQYRQLRTLTDYLLLAQDEPRVEHYAREEGDAWLFREYAGLEVVVALPSIACELRLAEVYAKVLD